MTRPILLGHRGARASRSVRENTLASFELCLQHGCDGFEFDVRHSSDGQAVICHDPTVAGVEIAKASVNRLLLPTLEDVLRQFAHRAFLDIELKVAGLESQMLAELGKHPPQKGYVVSSFLPVVLTTIRDLAPATPLGFLCETKGHLRGWRQMAVEWLIPHFDLVDQALVEQVHAAGNRIMLWTVNGEKRMRECAEWGADAIISDETELLVHSVVA